MRMFLFAILFSVTFTSVVNAQTILAVRSSNIAATLDRELAKIYNPVESKKGNLDVAVNMSEHYQAPVGTVVKPLEETIMELNMRLEKLEKLDRK